METCYWGLTHPSLAVPPSVLGQRPLSRLTPSYSGPVLYQLHTASLYSIQFVCHDAARETCPKHILIICHLLSLKPPLRISRLLVRSLRCFTNYLDLSSIFISGDSFPHPSNNGHLVIFQTHQAKYVLSTNSEPGTNLNFGI